MFDDVAVRPSCAEVGMRWIEFLELLTVLRARWPQRRPAETPRPARAASGGNEASGEDQLGR